MVTKAKQLHDPCGNHPTLDWVNSVSRSTGREFHEAILEYGDLLLWSTQAGTLTEKRATQLSAVARADPEGAEAARLRSVEVRESMFRVFEAIIHDGSPPESDMKVINGELAGALPYLRVEAASAGFDWVWCSKTVDLGMPIWPLVRGAAELLVSPDLNLVGQCASDTCLWLFLDRTRNHARRWCDMKVCGNRAKVRQHRQRRKGSLKGK